MHASRGVEGSVGMPDELDGVKASNLACCHGGIALLLIKVGWHLQSSVSVYHCILKCAHTRASMCLLPPLSSLGGCPRVADH